MIFNVCCILQNTVALWVTIFFSLFWEEISACVAVLKFCVVDAFDSVRSIILLRHMVGASFVLVELTR